MPCFLHFEMPHFWVIPSLSFSGLKRFALVAGGNGSHSYVLFQLRDAVAFKRRLVHRRGEAWCRLKALGVLESGSCFSKLVRQFKDGFSVFFYELEASWLVVLWFGGLSWALSKLLVDILGVSSEKTRRSRTFQTPCETPYGSTHDTTLQRPHNEIVF